MTVFAIIYTLLCLLILPRWTGSVRPPGVPTPAQPIIKSVGQHALSNAWIGLTLGLFLAGLGYVFWDNVTLACFPTVILVILFAWAGTKEGKDRLPISNELEERGVVVTGKIIECQPSGRRSSGGYITCTFGDNHQVREHAHSSVFHKLKVGTAVKVKYLPDYPAIARILDLHLSEAERQTSLRLRAKFRDDYFDRARNQ